ncbi:hypothetical protein G6M86_06480 [Agrobacterium tumefaciens]|uniref:Uncharacterized protein n=1 Tax=Agrobacterium tumefaciens TaxID=358 RepID=A0AAJ4N0Q9_AGRTU|nr:hypothetical protein G6M86_06480 [Agrobacterium tumefaciens]
MTDIISIDPVDFAGAIGHLAANGLYAILEGRDLENENWFGGDLAQSEHDVYILAEYVSRTEASGERLWRFAAIEALTDDGNYGDITLSRRLAFNLFASTSLQALRELKAVQDALAQILAVAEYKEPPALKIEDSIFEPHGSLGDQEAYQAQWLKDQQAADRRALDEAKASEAAADTMSLGAPIETETEDQNRPTALSVGQQEGATDEKETADKGQEAGGEPAADAGAQGSVADMVDNLPEAVDGDGGTPQADASDMASSPQQQAGEAGSSGDEGLSDDEAATGAATTDTGDSVSDSSLGDDQPQQGPEQSTDAAVPEEASGGDGKAAGTAIEPPETPVKSKKTRKGKSPN